MSNVEQFDIVIAGGGLVGASLALALSQLDLKIALVELAVPGSIPTHASFDERTTALSNGSRRTFAALGVWDFFERDATPIRRIHISDRGRFGFARISAEEQGIDALGYVLPNRILGEALWQRLNATSVQVVAPARVTGMQQLDHGCEVTYERSGAGAFVLRTKLAVAADGADSALRTFAGIDASKWDYSQVAIVTNVLTQKFHDHTAYERFTPEGPIAVLPLTEGRCGLIWTAAPKDAEGLLALNDAEFLSRLQAAFGFRLGRFMRVGQRYSYPLALTRAHTAIAPRLAVIGNAAQGLHPIAGQGFNLGLRDAAALAEVLADAKVEFGTHFDAGDGLLLERYREWREGDQQRIVQFTDGLVRLFAQPLTPIRWVRDVGLLAFDLMPTAKDALSQLSLGAAGRVPRLARGAPLVRT